MAYIGTEPIPPVAGGTGVANANTSTLTLGGSLALIGAFTTQFHLTNNTNVTFPTSGVLATTSVPGGGTGTNTFTQFSVLLGNGIGAIQSVGPSATTGAPLISAGAAADPAFSTTASVIDANVQFLVTGAVVGGVSQISLVNTDNGNASSGARFTLQSGGTSAGDAYTQYTCGDITSTWQTGVKNSTNSFLINQGATVATALMTGNTTVSITSAGEITMPLQPSFLAYQPSDATNVSGTGTSYTLGTTVDLTEVFDQNSDFDPTTGTFTSPVTGRYFLGVVIYWSGLTIATIFIGNIVTSNRTYGNAIGRAANSNDLSNLITALADMDAADTCTFSGAVIGEAGDTADVHGAGNPLTYCYGNLEC